MKTTKTTKTIKHKVLERDPNEKTVCLYSKNSKSFDKLVEIVKKGNKVDTKIFAKARASKLWKLMLFVTTKPKSNDPTYFKISLVTYSYAVNKNGKIYAKNKSEKSFTYKDKKLWSINTDANKKVKPTSIAEVVSITKIDKGATFFHTEISEEASEQIKAILGNLPYINTFQQHYELNGFLTYNHAVRHKIFSLKDRITYATGGIKGDKILEAFNGNVPQAVGVAADISQSHNRKLIKQYKYLIDDGKINPDILSDRNIRTNILPDTLRMAAIYDAPVRLRWSTKRFVAFHDKMSKDITIKTAELDKAIFTIPNYITAFVKHFNETSFLKAHVVKDSTELALHGLEQSHCVASYSDSIQQGFCYIVIITNPHDGTKWTAQLTKFNLKEHMSLNYAQLLGIKNKQPPAEITKELTDALGSFNKIDVSTTEPEIKDDEVDAELPQRGMNLDFVLNNF